jgi:hypothetical protein
VPLPSWRAASPVMPRRSAAITCPTGGARAAIGRWATFAIRPGDRCSSGSVDRIPVPALLGIGPMPPRPNMAICSTSSARAAVSSISAMSPIGTRDVILAGPQIPAFHDPAKPHLHPADLDIALDIDRYDFAVLISCEDGRLVARKEPA